MTTYTINFLISLLIIFVVFFFYRKKISSFAFKCGIIVVPALTYRFFYNENFATIPSWFIDTISYFGGFWIALFYISLVSFKQQKNTCKKEHSCIKIALIFLLQALSFLLCILVPWAVQVFPLSSPEAVLFSLFMPVEGAEGFVIETLKEKVLAYGIISFTAIISLQIIGSLLLFKYKIEGKNTNGFISIALAQTPNIKERLYQASKIVLKFLLGCAFISLIFIPSILYSPAFKAFFAESVDSEFYKKEYINPKEISKPNLESPKNLIVIFLESIETNLEPFTPEINDWKKKGLNFYPGGTSVAGTGWSIAGITAALCGVPINMPYGIVNDSYNGDLPSYLPGATCIMELLRENGYNQSSIRGVNKRYTQVGKFWKAHGDIDVKDADYYRERYDNLPAAFRIFDGIEDKKLFEFARKELDSLGSLERPFAFYMTTADTHLPQGFLDSSCTYTEKTKFQNVLRCSSYMTGNFLEWISQQPWYKNTIVMAIGDHVTPGLSARVELSPDEKLYTVAFFLNAPTEGINTNRTFSNLDYAPTILELLGWQLPRHGFALGRSLLSNEQTLLESYGRDSLETNLRQQSIQYDEFLLKK